VQNATLSNFALKIYAIFTNDILQNSSKGQCRQKTAKNSEKTLKMAAVFAKKTHP